MLHLPKSLEARRRSLTPPAEVAPQQHMQQTAPERVRSRQYSDVLTYKDTNSIKLAIADFDILQAIKDFVPVEKQGPLKNFFSDKSLNESFICLLDESYETLMQAQGYGFDTNRLPLQFESRSEMLTHFTDNAERIITRKFKNANRSTLKDIPETILPAVQSTLAAFLINKASSIGRENDGWSASIAANSRDDQSARAAR